MRRLSVLVIPVIVALLSSALLVAQQLGLREMTVEPPPPPVLVGPDSESVPLPTLDTSQVSLDTSELLLSLPDPWETDPTSGVQYRKNEVLVQFQDSAASSARVQAMNEAGGVGISRYLPGGWEVVSVGPETSAPAALAAFQTHPAVARAGLNYRSKAFQQTPNDQYFNLQWNFSALNLPKAWEINPGATSAVTVAIIDTGLNVQGGTVVFNSPIVGRVPIQFAVTPDLVTADRIVQPFDFVYGDTLPLDLGGHGTHVAGTIGQLTNNEIGLAGVAYNVRLMPLKVISGGEGLFSWDDIFNPGNRSGADDLLAQAVRYAADNGANVINMSLGRAGPPAAILRDALQYAVDHGAFVAIAAGNDGSNGNPVEYPAAYGGEIDGVMTVGALDRQLGHAYYSGHQPYVEICAPGGSGINFNQDDYQNDITQVGYNEPYTLSSLSLFAKLLALRIGFRPRFDQFKTVAIAGTSMATPHVSGVAALLYSQGIRDPRAIEEVIKRFAAPISASPEECGAGLVDPRRALRGLGLAR